MPESYGGSSAPSVASLPGGRALAARPARPHPDRPAGPDLPALIRRSGAGTVLMDQRWEMDRAALTEHPRTRGYRNAMARKRVTLLDRCYQLALWFAFQGLRVVWFVRRPNQHGALVLIWFEGRVLLVRNSYQSRWSAPGGSVERSESALDAAVREIAE
ncbi:NUDIX domain-containing protein [Methylobacterium sp. P31]